MCCLFSAGENLSNISRGRDLGRNGVVGCDHQFACRLMDSASSTEPHIVQVLLPYHCKQIEHIILRCLRCTLPASPSYPAHETRARTHTPPLHASSTDSADRRYVHRDQVPFHAFHCLFSMESLQNMPGPNDIKNAIFRSLRFHRIFFSIEKKIAKTCPHSRKRNDY